MRPRIRALPVAAVLALCWWSCLGAVPALAHTELQTSSPQQGAVVDVAPATVRLTFGEDLGGGSLAVTAAGRSLGAGAARVDGPDLELGIAPGAPGGVWTVAYRVVSADGHPVTGQFTFTVETDRTPGTATPSPVPSPSATPTAATPASNTHDSHDGGSANPASGKVHPSPVVEVAVTALAMVALVVGVFVRRRGN